MSVPQPRTFSDCLTQQASDQAHQNPSSAALGWTIQLLLLTERPSRANSVTREQLGSARVVRAVRHATAATPTSVTVWQGNRQQRCSSRAAMLKVKLQRFVQVDHSRCDR